MQFGSPGTTGVRTGQRRVASPITKEIRSHRRENILSSSKEMGRRGQVFGVGSGWGKSDLATYT